MAEVIGTLLVTGTAQHTTVGIQLEVCMIALGAMYLS